MCCWRITNGHKQNGFELKVLTLVLILDMHSIIVTQHLQILNQRPEKVSMSFLGCCGPGINPDIIIYFCLLHNQGGIFTIVSTIGYMLCVLLFMNGFIPSVLIVILIFLKSMANSEFRESIFRHGVASAGCHIILASCLCFSLCHHKNLTPCLQTNASNEE
jgi:hypothetical protein